MKNIYNWILNAIFVVFCISKKLPKFLDRFFDDLNHTIVTRKRFKDIHTLETPVLYSLDEGEKNE